MDTVRVASKRVQPALPAVISAVSFIGTACAVTAQRVPHMAPIDARKLLICLMLSMMSGWTTICI